MSNETNKNPTALADAEQDQDAERLKSMYPNLHDKIEMRITQQGFTPDRVELWLDKWYGWHETNNIRVMCINAAKSIYRKHVGNEEKP
jgi:hypothetical protein